MIVVYTTVNVFAMGETNQYPSVDNTLIGGDRTDLLETGAVGGSVTVLMPPDYDNMSVQDRKDYLSDLHGGDPYIEFVWKFPFGENYYIFPDSFKMIDYDYIDFYNGDYEGGVSVKESWFDPLVNFFNMVAGAFNYVFDFLSFNILNPVEGIPTVLSFISLLMVLPVWITIIYLMFPYIISMINAIGNIIPF